MTRVTGIGGIFIKAKDPEMLQNWYKKHLGIDVQAWGEPPLNGSMVKESHTQVPLPG